MRFGGRLPRSESMDVVLSPFDSSCYREQQEMTLREIQKKPCTTATLPAIQSLVVRDHRFEVYEKFARPIAEFPSGIIELLEATHGKDNVQKLKNWCHPQRNKEKSSTTNENIPGEIEPVSEKVIFISGFCFFLKYFTEFNYIRTIH